MHSHVSTSVGRRASLKTTLHSKSWDTEQQAYYSRKAPTDSDPQESAIPQQFLSENSNPMSQMTSFLNKNNYIFLIVNI